ncbi:hypothetical protein H4582DRAFT_2056197 [Lactarius indigo]|nr:hypothetical protein H4582DRAFT_2056197 [Lactarius indigo]
MKRTAYYQRNKKPLQTYQREYAQRKRAPGYRKVSKAERALLEERTPDMIEEEERARNCFDELKFILQTFCLFPWIEPFQKHVEDFIQERLSEAASIIAVPGIEEEDSIRLHGLRRLVAGAIQEVELVQQPGYATTCARENGAIIWDGQGVNSRKFRQRYGW